MNAVRNDESPEYYDPGYPDALDLTIPCPCGGEALFHPAGPKADVARIQCSRCSRMVPILEGRQVEQGVTLWNLDCNAT